MIEPATDHEYILLLVRGVEDLKESVLSAINELRSEIKEVRTQQDSNARQLNETTRIAKETHGAVFGSDDRAGLIDQVKTWRIYLTVIGAVVTVIITIAIVIAGEALKRWLFP